MHGWCNAIVFHFISSNHDGRFDEVNNEGIVNHHITHDALKFETSSKYTAFGLAKGWRANTVKIE